MMTFILTPMTQVTQEVDFITCEQIPFNIEKDAPKVGQSITLRGNDTIYGVIRRLDCTYRYYNPITQELSNVYNNLNQRDIESI